MNDRYVVNRKAKLDGERKFDWDTPNTRSEAVKKYAGKVESVRRLPDEDIILSVFPDAGEKGTPRGWMTISIERVRVPGRVFVVPTRTERGTSEVKILAGLLSI
ncbi:hypothetical protein RUM43_002874 [Polyplax serrata]|uniref:Uncharacterized protein n=1 Tax=Polyplax serrata TaxID=468196 RepID=A0AAN8PEK8_POLSC